MFVREHLIASIRSKVGGVSAVSSILLELDLLFLSAIFIAVQTEASALQLITRFIFIVILGVVQLVGVHIDFAFGSVVGSVAPVFAVGSGVIRVLEPYAVFVLGRAIDSGIFVQVCSIGDRNRSAVIQIKP